MQKFFNKLMTFGLNRDITGGKLDKFCKNSFFYFIENYCFARA